MSTTQTMDNVIDYSKHWSNMVCHRRINPRMREYTPSELRAWMEDVHAMICRKYNIPRPKEA